MSNLKELLSYVESGNLNSTLETLYIDKARLPKQRERYKKALLSYKQNFDDGVVRIYSAPGRTEIGGNHTDHQHGCVLAAAVNLDTLAIVSKRKDDQIHIISEGFKIKPVNLTTLAVNEKEVGTSEALIRGVCAGVKNLGFQIGGLNIYMTSDVLEGAGLSSSASFETLIGTVLSEEFNDGAIDPIDIAKIGQYSENEYFQKPCGLMDEMACSVGGFISIDFKTPASPNVEKHTFDFETYQHTLCIVDTKGSHGDLTYDYAAITEEMRNVSQYFGKAYLRDVDEATFYLNVKRLREACGDRSVLRAHHFFRENERVLKEVEALKTANFVRFKQLVQESGDSSFKYLQNVYAAKQVHEQNLAIGLALSEHILINRGVARVHGGGFAGTIQAYVPNDLLDEYKKQMEAVFGEGSCYVLKIRSCGGLKVI